MDVKLVLFQLQKLHIFDKPKPFLLIGVEMVARSSEM